MCVCVSESYTFLKIMFPIVGTDHLADQIKPNLPEECKAAISLGCGPSEDLQAPYCLARERCPY